MKTCTIFLTINKATLIKHFNISNNVITLVHPRIINNTVTFGKTALFNNKVINMSKQSSNFQNDYNNNPTSLHRNKHHKIDSSQLIIVCDLDDFKMALASNKNTINYVFKSLSQTINKEKERDVYIVLLVATNKTITKFNKSSHTLSVELVSKLKKNKSPNVQSNHGKKHNKSFGTYFGFGLINKYRIKDGLSFGEFDNSKKTTEKELCHLEDSLRKIFNKLSERLNNCFPGLVNNGNNLISSVIDYGILNSNNSSFTRMIDKNRGLNEKQFSIWVCKNARTEEFHQEIDSSYTLISVPFQELINQKTSIKTYYKFQFRWEKIDIDCPGIDILLEPGTVLFYNGLCLFHRQVPNDEGYKSSNFLNFSMYHNKRLYNSINKSIYRFNEL